VRGAAGALALAPRSAHSILARGDWGPLMRFYLPEMGKRIVEGARIRRGGVSP
jgi:hypothetical protein